MDIGVVIGKYRIVEHIGRGGMADVWSARDQQLNRMVAVKTIAHGLSQEVDPVGMFKSEAQTIAQMEHPHILPIYDFGEFEGQLYIVMRYVTGGSLEERLHRGPLPLDEALKTGQAIAQALDYAHSNKIIHLDLKPPNVLLDSQDAPYLADFGLATKLNIQGKAYNPGSGTLLYMSPEQLTAKIIDHRADLYSFGVMMFHILVGKLPFDGDVSLAMRQMQTHEGLPDLSEINPDIPPAFTDVLREATAPDPDARPEKLIDVINELRDILVNSTAFVTSAAAMIDPARETYETLASNMPDDVELEVLEALDIYSRALHAWSSGNGRFLLGVTHFMLMDGYYRDAKRYNLEISNAGLQMLLRGAMEYDIDVDYWWNKLSDDDRRWVCLHALRSGNAPARIRALYRLETLTDAASPQIPKLVAQALQIETNDEARIAALRVLGTRSRLLKRDQLDIKTEYRGRMLTTLTRQDVQIRAPSEWIEVVYTPEIDLLIAEVAFDRDSPDVAEFAARIVGQMRSTTAVRYVVKQDKQGRRGARRALALIRDEAASLPSVVSPQGRIYAWGTNTIRRMFQNPMGLVFRYLAALIGGWVGMGGFYIWTVYRSEGLFTSARWGASLAMGLVFGVFIGFVVLCADEFSSRLRGFWPWWGRLGLSAFIGVLLSSLAYNQFTWFYLNYTPDQDVMYFGGFGLAFGFVLTALLRLRSFIAIPLTATATYIPIWLTWEYYWNFSPELPLTQVPILYYDSPAQVVSSGIPLVLMIAIGGHFPGLVQDVMELVRHLRQMRAKRRFEAERLATVVPNVNEYAADIDFETRQVPAGADPNATPDGTGDLKTEPITQPLFGAGPQKYKTEPLPTDLDVSKQAAANAPKTEVDVQSLDVRDSQEDMRQVHVVHQTDEVDKPSTRSSRIRLKKQDEDDGSSENKSDESNTKSSRITLGKRRTDTELDPQGSNNDDDSQAGTKSSRIRLSNRHTVTELDPSTKASKPDAEQDDTGTKSSRIRLGKRTTDTELDPQRTVASVDVSKPIDDNHTEDNKEPTRSSRIRLRSKPDQLDLESELDAQTIPSVERDTQELEAADEQDEKDND